MLKKINIALLVFLIISAPLAVSADEPVHLVPQNGVIYLNRSSLPGPIHVTTDEPIQEKDEVETLWYAAADLVFTQGPEELAVIRVKETTKLTVQKVDLTPGKENIVLQVHYGKVVVTKNNLKEPNQLQILSPASAVNVQGMGFQLKPKKE